LWCCVVFFITHTHNQKPVKMADRNQRTSETKPQHTIKRKPVPRPEERGGHSQQPKRTNSRRNPEQPLEKRLTTDSEIAFAWYGAPLPNLHRSDARAGNGQSKQKDLEEKPAPKLRQRASTFSFTENEDVNRSEAGLEGHDATSFASRMRNRANTDLKDMDRPPRTSKNSTRRRRPVPEQNRDSYGRPLSTIDEDVSLLEGVPKTMMPSSAEIPPRRVHEIRDFNRTPSPPLERRPPVDRSLYRDSQVRLSTTGADIGSMGGFLSTSDKNMPSPAPPRMREQRPPQPQPMRESRFYEVFSGSPLQQIEKMSVKEEKKKARQVRFKEEMDWPRSRAFL
jgi:hypothetical protein